MSANETAAGQSSSVFLETIPKKALGIVLRFLSRLPKSKNWERHIPFLDLVELLRVNRQLGKMIANHFSALCVSKTGDYATETCSWRWEPPSEGMLSTIDISKARTYILAGGGQALRTLTIGLGIYREERDVVEIVDDFFSN